MGILRILRILRKAGGSTSSSSGSSSGSSAARRGRGRRGLWMIGRRLSFCSESSFFFIVGELLFLKWSFVVVFARRVRSFHLSEGISEDSFRELHFARSEIDWGFDGDSALSDLLRTVESDGVVRSGHRTEYFEHVTQRSTFIGCEDHRVRVEGRDAQI